MGDENGYCFKVVLGGGSSFACASSVSDHQVDSQMATPSADPCLALADTQLASAAEQAGPLAAAKRRDLWTR